MLLDTSGWESSTTQGDAFDTAVARSRQFKVQRIQFARENLIRQENQNQWGHSILKSELQEFIRSDILHGGDV